MGNITPGIIPAMKRYADNKVEPVSSKTMRLMGRLMVWPAMADMIVPMVIRVKSLDQTFSVLTLFSQRLLSFELRTQIGDNESALYPAEISNGITLSTGTHIR